MTSTRYHSFLRTSLLLFAFLLVFDSGIAIPITRTLSDDTLRYLAQSAGVFAQIEPNELNTITAELTAQKKELDEREAALRTIEVRGFGESNDENYSTYILSVILFILTLLILTNYVLDFRRAQTPRP